MIYKLSDISLRKMDNPLGIISVAENMQNNLW